MNKLGERLFWIGVVIFLVLLGLILGSCTSARALFGMSTATTGSQTIIPSSPASQMWKVVAKSNWVVTICLLGFGGGLFTFFNGKPKLGLAIVFSSLGTLFFGLAVHRFPTWMAIVGLLGSVAGVAASILMKHRAVIELIKGGQIFKKEFEHDAEEFNKKQKQEQSPTTQKLVKKIKGELKLKGEIE